MAADVLAFWDEVLARWFPTDAVERERVVHVILFHLRRWLAPGVREWFTEKLPPELELLSQGAGLVTPQEAGLLPAVQAEPSLFYHEVARDGDVTQGDAEVASQAVFAGLKKLLTREETHRVAHHLPRGLDEAWEKA